MKQGLIHVYCGDGKGKTTAAAGLALRAAGCGERVIFAQFMKGNESGELSAMERIQEIELLRNSRNYGFYKNMSDADKKEITREHNEILKEVMRKIESGGYGMVILDEITYPYELDLIDKSEVERLIKEKPPSLELVLTGREPDELFLEYADYITRMKCIRHPYEKGIPARRGVEF
ncbi:cob(I)alamin adenosyltransferase [Kineothrix alysoides]|uniref:Cob(I)alamin adenosyltransferase n=1 Tax=Kineothrix alysoides TaxID=1469948 RepID=A0A4R1QP31_9FIRM|nr:cob(I)yrinic acid a,c-diamide adenosyltransferase [Kineothrix alysoides]TCL55468.1 cob(I)alamin adenosyltransferase [Kineothrix alysoides]